jgi:hypothetical protein
MKIWIRVLVGLALVMLVASSLPAQQISATLTGIVSDPSNAVVPQAQIKLRNESSGSERVTITNNEGYFTFASLDVGDYTYELTVTAKGFLTYKAPGIALSGGEKRNVNVTLKVGSTTEVVERKVGHADAQRTGQLRRGGQQRGRIHQNDAGVQYPERHEERCELHR